MTCDTPTLSQSSVLKIAVLPACNRAKPADSAFSQLDVLTSAGESANKQKTDTRTFASGQWGDNVTTRIDWEIPCAANVKAGDAAGDMVRSSGFSNVEVYVILIYSDGSKIEGVASIDSYKRSAPKDGIVTADWTLSGRGPATLTPAPAS